jgi:short-subunit dehydrogenase
VMGSREVAEEAYRAMLHGQPLVVAGFMNKLRIASLRLAPRGMTRRIAANLNKAN